MFLRPVRSSWPQFVPRNFKFAVNFSSNTTNPEPSAPVDPLSCKQYTHRVYATSEPWDVLLNQTDIKANKNKNRFYMIQLLQSMANPQSFIVYTRWGRVGALGQTRLEMNIDSVAEAEDIFRRKFRLKTGVEWAKREDETPVDGKYSWLDRQYDTEPATADSQPIPVSTLAPEVITLCNLIFSQDLIDVHLASMNYNADKMPLGKLARSTISKGFATLKRLADVMDDPKGHVARRHGGANAAYEAISSTYYSLIPHVSGRLPPPVVNNPEILKRELDLMDSLLDMGIVSKILNSAIDKDGKPVHPMDARFRSLKLSHISPIPKDSLEYGAIAAYIQDTEVRSSLFSIDISHVFSVEREGEKDAWLAAGHDQLQNGERLLLWHGSRSTNFGGILKNGLRIAPSEAPSSGYMFGRGVYFADMVSKSFNYCHSSLSEGQGLLLLCEVAAGPFFEQQLANSNADIECAAAGKRSTKGLGRSTPAAWADAGQTLYVDDLRGCMMPLGAKRLRTKQPALNHNEYIVYNLNQIRLRYVVMVKTRDKM